MGDLSRLRKIYSGDKESEEVRGGGWYINNAGRRVKSFASPIPGSLALACSMLTPQMIPQHYCSSCTTGFTALQFQNQKKLEPSFCLQLQRLFKWCCTNMDGLSHHSWTGQLGYNKSFQANWEPFCPILRKPNAMDNHVYLCKAGSSAPAWPFLSSK